MTGIASVVAMRFSRHFYIVSDIFFYVLFSFSTLLTFLLWVQKSKTNNHKPSPHVAYYITVSIKNLTSQKKKKLDTSPLFNPRMDLNFFYNYIKNYSKVVTYTCYTKINYYYNYYYHYNHFSNGVWNIQWWYRWSIEMRRQTQFLSSNRLCYTQSPIFLDYSKRLIFISMFS